MQFDAEPRPWSQPDEDATATINYTSGTTARPKGVQITCNIWVNAMSFGMHGCGSATSTCTPCRCSMPTGGGCRTRWPGWSATQVVLRKVDGPKSPAPRRATRRHPDVRSPRGVERGAGRGDRLRRGGSRPRPGPDRRRRRHAAEPDDPARRAGAGLGVHPDLGSPKRRRSSRSTGPARPTSSCPSERARKSSRAGAPALGVQVRVSDEGEVLVRSNVVLEVLEQPGGHCRRAGGRVVPHRRRYSMPRGTSRSPTGRRM